VFVTGSQHIYLFGACVRSDAASGHCEFRSHAHAPETAVMLQAVLQLPLRERAGAKMGK